MLATTGHMQDSCHSEVWQNTSDYVWHSAWQGVRVQVRREVLDDTLSNVMHEALRGAHYHIDEELR